MKKTAIVVGVIGALALPTTALATDKGVCVTYDQTTGSSYAKNIPAKSDVGLYKDGEQVYYEWHQDATSKTFTGLTPAKYNLVIESHSYNPETKSWFTREDVCFEVGVEQPPVVVPPRIDPPSPPAPPVPPVQKVSPPPVADIPAIGTPDPPPPATRLRVRKSAPRKVDNQKAFSYRIRVTNSGRDVSRVKLVDILPNGLSLVERPTIEGGSVNITGRKITFGFRLRPRASRTLVIRVRPLASTRGQRCNTAQGTDQTRRTVRGRACTVFTSRVSTFLPPVTG